MLEDGVYMVRVAQRRKWEMGFLLSTITITPTLSEHWYSSPLHNLYIISSVSYFIPIHQLLLTKPFPIGLLYLHHHAMTLPFHDHHHNNLEFHLLSSTNLITSILPPPSSLPLLSSNNTLLTTSPSLISQPQTLLLLYYLHLTNTGSHLPPSTTSSHPILPSMSSPPNCQHSKSDS